MDRLFGTGSSSYWPQQRQYYTDWKFAFSFIIGIVLALYFEPAAGIETETKTIISGYQGNLSFLTSCFIIISLLKKPIAFYVCLSFLFEKNKIEGVNRLYDFSYIYFALGFFCGYLILILEVLVKLVNA